MSQAFYRKWRPQTWDEVVSQDHVVQTLRNAVRTGRIGHAYLLAGPRGTGKTTTARLLAKSLNCTDSDPAKRPCDACEHCKALNEGRFLDLVEIDAASNTSVDDVRDLREKINFRPSQGQFKVYIIDEVHMLSTAAFNALLKTLEEPPPHAIFILATTEVHKIPATVLSRCQRYEFRRIPVPEIVKYLTKMADEEGLQVDEDALTLIARQSTGAMRDAISLLDQLASTGERVTLAEAQVVLGTATSMMVVELVEALIQKDAGKGLTLVQKALDAGTDARQFARQAVDYLRSLLLIRMGNANQVDATADLRKEMTRQAQAFDTPRLLATIRLFNAAATDARAAWHPGLPLELAFAESIEEKAVQVVEVSAQAAARPAGAAPTARPAPSAGNVPTAIPERQPVTPPPAAQPPAAQLRQSAPPSMPDDMPEAPPFDEAPPSRPAANPPASRPTAQPAGKPASQQPAPSAQPSGGGPAPSLNDIQHNWNKIKQVVHTKNKLTSAALNSCRSFTFKDGTLILGFVSEVVKSKMETPENLEILRKALQEVLGATCAIRCVVASSKGGSASELDVDGDGMVNEALNLGGKIVYEE